MSARLENFTEEEKKILSEILKKKLFVISAIYVIVILLSVAFMIYFNKYSESYFLQNNLEVINVVFVIISVICARMLVSEILEYAKEIKSPVKKVVETKILGRDENRISLGNKSFDENDFIFGIDDFESFKIGDNVRIELSAKTDTLFTLKKVLHS